MTTSSGQPHEERNPASTSSSPPPTGPGGIGSTPPTLVQAPVAAVDADGLGVVAAGTVVFAGAAVVAGVFYVDLSARGHGWWLGTCVAGFALGLAGLAYCWIRRSRRRAGDWTTN